MTYQKFIELTKKDAEERQKLQDEIATLMEEEAKIDAEMKVVADQGDVDRYLGLSAEKETIAKKIYVKRTFQDKRLPLVCESDALEAWKDYVTGHNKRIKEAIASFEAEKKVLCAMYSEMVDIQNAACIARELLSNAVGVPATNFKMETIPFIDQRTDLSNENYNYITHLNGLTGVADPDVCYYLSNHLKKTGEKIFIYSASDIGNRSPEADRITNVVIKQKSN